MISASDSCQGLWLLRVVSESLAHPPINGIIMVIMWNNDAFDSAYNSSGGIFSYFYDTSKCSY